MFTSCLKRAAGYVSIEHSFAKETQSLSITGNFFSQVPHSFYAKRYFWKSLLMQGSEYRLKRTNLNTLLAQKIPSTFGNSLFYAGIGIVGACFLKALYDRRGESSEANLTLEERFQSACLQTVDVNKIINFQDFLDPNEGTPGGVKLHLDKIIDPGLIVSTGTERSFFDLALCDPEKCLGLVVRDINPRVKAYVDFNTLLLRIADNRFEYEELSSAANHFNERVNRIQRKLEDSPLSEPLKQYYLNNLQNFADIYFYYSLRWKKDSCFEGVYYHKDDQLFKQLQSYAKAGKIIATIGDINDLRFLSDYPIAAVDISNIPDYALMNVQGGENFHPLIIWTNAHPDKTTYHSYLHCKVSLEVKEEIDAILDALFSKCDSEWYGLNIRSLLSSDELVCYSVELLLALKKYQQSSSSSR